jgi:hypothetical protein
MNLIVLIRTTWRHDYSGASVLARKILLLLMNSATSHLCHIVVDEIDY